MHHDDVLGSFVRSHPLDAIRISIFLVFAIWFSVPALIGGAIFLFLPQFKIDKKTFALIVPIVVSLCFLSESYHHGFISISKEIHHGWQLNGDFWKRLYQEKTELALFSLLKQGFNFLVAVPLIVTSLLAAIDLLPMNPHRKNIAAIYQGKTVHPLKELPSADLTKALQAVTDVAEGTALGVSTLTGKLVSVLDNEINQVVFVLGTTGAGKTITLRHFYRRAILKGYPLIIVDGKPTEENVNWVQTLAKKEGRTFYGFNCADNDHYDPLANGGYTELKDKIISLKDEWENDYYRSIAEDYLQTTLQVLLQSGKPFDLATIVKCLNYDCLIEMTRDLKDKNLMSRVNGLEHYERSDITGLQAHLNLLIHSELGEYFEINEKVFQIANAIKENAIVYFALPALRFPSFSKVLGKLVINDLKAVIDRQNTDKRVFMVFDEFSVFAGEQVLNLVNMGRGKGVHAIFGTQGPADLDRVDISFKNQLLNCANTIICHRINDHSGAEEIANWFGTKDKLEITAQFDTHCSTASLGNVKQIKGFMVHPDWIKQELGTGEAFFISKVNGFRQDKIKVKYL